MGYGCYKYGYCCWGVAAIMDNGYMMLGCTAMGIALMLLSCLLLRFWLHYFAATGLGANCCYSWPTCVDCLSNWGLVDSVVIWASNYFLMYFCNIYSGLLIALSGAKPVIFYSHDIIGMVLRCLC